MKLSEELNDRYFHDESGILIDKVNGYWSNLNQDENEKLIEALNDYPSRQALSKYHPELEEVIYSPKRQAGLEFLGLNGSETCIDYGCMWGALTIPLAKRTNFVLGVDQTLDSLKFLKARIREEKLDNIELLCLDLKEMPILENKVDVAIINGVLEWIPEHGSIELKSYYGKFHKKEYNVRPDIQQINFLKKVYSNLNDKGKMYLAIENRFDYKMFLGLPDPHANLLFTSILPRKMANYISLTVLGRPYVNWLYSFQGIKQILRKSGFSKVDLYMCFPDYRFPERIIPYSKSLINNIPLINVRNAKGKISLKRVIARIIEIFIFKVFGIKALSPSIVAIAFK